MATRTEQMIQRFTALQIELFDHEWSRIGDMIALQRGNDYIAANLNDEYYVLCNGVGNGQTFYARKTSKHDYEQHFLTLEEAYEYYTS